MLRRAFLGVAVLAMALTAGCQSMSTSSAQPLAATRAVVVSGNGGTTVVYIPSADGKQVVMMDSAGAVSCPDCKAAAAKYFETGMLEKTCPTCKGTRTAVSLEATTGHN